MFHCLELHGGLTHPKAIRLLTRQLRCQADLLHHGIRIPPKAGHKPRCRLDGAATQGLKDRLG